MNHSIFWYIGLLLLPSATILCLVEFLWKLVMTGTEMDPAELYFLKSLGWFVGLGKDGKKH